MLDSYHFLDASMRPMLIFFLHLLRAEDKNSGHHSFMQAVNKVNYSNLYM